MKTIAIVPDKETVSAYQSLLKSEWTEQSIGAALDLARRVLANAGCRLVFHWEEQRGSAATFVVSPETSDQLRDFMLSFYVDKSPEAVPRLPTRRGKDAVRLAHSCEALSVLLNFQYLAKTRLQIMIDDEAGLYRNCQSLLVNLGIHFLLPELSARKLQKEKRFVTHAIALHLAQVWRDDLRHQAYLSGVLAAYLGNDKLSRSDLEYAFATTTPEEHDYLTTAHILWYHYLDARDMVAAKDFVLSLYRSAPREHLDEIGQMVSDTYLRRTA